MFLVLLQCRANSCWLCLSGCTLLFYETYGKNTSADQELSPRYALLADDSIVQAVPEHPKKEHVFCLSNSHGDVYLLQVRPATHIHTLRLVISQM